MKRLFLGLLAAGVLGAPALAQQQDDQRHADRQQRRISERNARAPEGAAIVGAPNPYATQGGAPNPYATRGGDPNPYATRGGGPGRHSKRGMDPNGTPPAPAILKQGSTRR